MTRTSQPHTSQPRPDQPQTRGLRRRITGVAAAIALAGSLTAVGVSAAQAQPQTTRRATVVRIVTTHRFGRILETIHKRPLYYKPTGRCTGACLTAWPPLLMPRGKTIPLGVRCLRTARFHRRLQVTYRGKRLYRFVGDTGPNPTGNGQQGFKVAKVRTGPCTSGWRY